jgi:hypothetical protein
MTDSDPRFEASVENGMDGTAGGTTLNLARATGASLVWECIQAQFAVASAVARTMGRIPDRAISSSD